MKRIIVFVLSVCICFSMPWSATAKDIVFFKDNTEVYVDGEYVKILENEGITPVIKDGIFYVPLRAFVELNNGKITWKNSGDQVDATIVLGSKYAIKTGSSEITFYDGSYEQMNANAYLNRYYNRIMIPADMFEKMGYTVTQVNDALGVRIEGKHNVTREIDCSETVEGSFLKKIKVEQSFATDDGDVNVSIIDDNKTNISNTAGKLGSVFMIDTVNGTSLQGKVTLTYSPELLGGSNENDLTLARYNELEEKMELLKNVNHDFTANTLSATIGASGYYVLIDGAKWAEVWSKQQLLIREDNDNRLFNVSFVLDVSGSMSSSISLLKSATLNFISELYPDDCVSVATFSNDSKKVLPAKYVKDITDEDKEMIKRITAGGGTDMHAGLEQVVFDVPNIYEDYRYENLLIVLSDGATEKKELVIEDAKRFGKENVRIISLALGSSSDVTLMNQLATETKGIYQYIDNASDLQSVFEIMRGASIGLEVDRDGDGIPDLIETTGMRDQYGELFITDPNEFDTDNDGYSDGDEMGILIKDDYAYFKRKSDPNLNSNFADTAKVELNENGINITNDNEEYGVADVRFCLDYIHFENLVLSENIYNEPKNIKVDVIHDDCLRLIRTNQTQIAGKYSEESLDIVGGNATTNSECINLDFVCEDDHNRKHDIILKVTGVNFNSFEHTISIDFEDIKNKYESMVKAEYESVMRQVQKEIDIKAKAEINNNISISDGRKENINKIYAKYFIEPSDISLSSDELLAVKEAVLKYASDKKLKPTVNSKGTDVTLTYDIGGWIISLFSDDKEKYTIDVSGNMYDIEVNKSFDGLKATINGEDVYCLVNSQEAMTQLSSFEEDLQKLADEAIDDVRKELLSLAGETIFTDSFMKAVDDKLLESINKLNPNLGELIKWGETIYESTKQTTSYSQMKEQCDDLLNKDFSPSVGKQITKLIGKIEKLVDND